MPSHLTTPGDTITWRRAFSIALTCTRDASYARKARRQGGLAASSLAASLASPGSQIGIALQLVSHALTGQFPPCPSDSCYPWHPWCSSPLSFSRFVLSVDRSVLARVRFMSLFRARPLIQPPAMRYILIASILLILAGCQNVVGPFRSPSPNRVLDSGYPAFEPQRSSRGKPALPDESPWTAPPTGIPSPGSWGVPHR
jgi:hypothetical protein